MEEPDSLEKQLMDLSGIKEPETPRQPIAPSAVNDTDYSAAHANRLAPVRTFNSDLANAVREHGGSVVRVAIAEEERQRQEYEETSINSKKNIAFIVAGVVLVLGAIGVGIYAYKYRQAASVAVVVTPAVPPSLVASDSAQTIDIGGMTPDGIVAAVANAVATPGIQTGQVKNIIITSTASGVTARPSASAFLAALGAHEPNDFSRSLSAEYMLGTYLYGTKDSLFFVIQGTAHDYMLSGMIGWEPYLFGDMVPLFGIDTSAYTKPQIDSMKFSDAVIGNRDARAVLDANGTPILYYSFLDPNTVVIAADSKTLTEVIRRY